MPKIRISFIYLRLLVLNAIAIYPFYDWFDKGIGPGLKHILAIGLLIYVWITFFTELRQYKLNKD